MKRALLLLALAACGNKKPMTARCELEPAGTEVPKALQQRPWLLHDLEVASKLTRRIHCVVEGRNSEKVWSDRPALKAETHRSTGDARMAYRLDEFAPDQKTLVLHWDGGSASIPVPEVPRISVEVKVDGSGVAHVTGTVSGGDEVTLAGEPVAVKAGAFATDVNLAPWVFAHATVADLPLDPLPGKLTMLVEAGAAHAMVTMPAPRLPLSQWVQGVLAEGAAVPFAPPRDLAHDAPTVVVFWDGETPKLRALVRDTKLGTVEAVAHVRDRKATLYTAADGAPVASQTFTDDDELAIAAWIVEQTRASRPAAP